MPSQRRGGSKKARKEIRKAALQPSLPLPPPVRCHLFVDSADDGTPYVALKLRQPFVSLSQAAASSPVSERERAAIAWLDGTLSRLNSLPPDAAAAEWASACGKCSQLLTAAHKWGASSAASLFSTVQLALQTGPLKASKAARFGLLRGWCGGLADHPHARAASDLLAAAERAVSRGIELSERQIALIERWSGELQRAFPPDASESSADFTSEQSDGEEDDEEASFDAMERAMRDAFYPRTAGEHFAIT